MQTYSFVQSLLYKWNKIKTKTLTYKNINVDNMGRNTYVLHFDEQTNFTVDFNFAASKANRSRNMKKGYYNTIELFNFYLGCAKSVGQICLV